MTRSLLHRRSTIALLALLVGAGTLAEPPPASAGKYRKIKYGKRPLKPGMRGKDVRVVQRYLSRLKERTRKTGYYGKRTRKSVRRLERRRRWRIDGKVDRGQAKRIKREVRRQRARRTGASGPQRFPIPGPHNYGGASARFGAGRSGHSHQGQDVFAACGEPLLSAQAGNVKARAYQGSGAGHYLVVQGVDGVDYAYMHLLNASWAGPGAYLYAGTQIGNVGASGNASGCHLHFELWTSPGWYSGGVPQDPLPSLLYWDSYS